MKRLWRVFFVVLALVAAGWLGFRFIQKPRPPAPPPPAVPQGEKWRGLTPGLTTLDQTVQALGQPLSSSTSGDATTLQYPSNNQYWPVDVEARNRTVSFIKESLFPPAERSLQKRMAPLGSNPTVLYGPEAPSGQLLFVFPDRGVAFLANQDRDVVYEAWYFPPTTVDGFLALPQAQEYSLKEGAPRELF